MIGHQAICPDRDLLCAAELRYELEVVLEVFVTEERPCLGFPRWVAWWGTPGAIISCQSSHCGKLTRPQPHVKS